MEPLNIETTDRYAALGMPQPDPEAMCKGQCEGTGVVPCLRDDPDERLRSAWLAAEKEAPNDHWHFVECPDCHGTGKAV